MLVNRHALVTGSTQGIGLEIALELVKQRCSVILHGLRDDAAAAEVRRRWPAISEFPLSIIFGNLADPMPDGPVQVAGEALRRNPAIDTLVCNAGTYIDQPFLEMDFATFDRTLKLNVYSQFVMVQQFARSWVQNGIAGRIILIGSINGRLSEPTHVAYDSSKGAIEAMVRSLCVSLAPHGIRVNGIAPGLLRTPLTEPALADPRTRRWMELHTPNGQVPGPSACAGAAAFLLSDSAEHIHGQMLFVDGGMSIWQQPDPPLGAVNSEWLTGQS